MRTQTTSIRCALGRLMPQSPASSDELRAMRAAAWHKQGIVVIPLADLYDDWDRQFLTGIATRLYGARTATTKQRRPWREGEVIDRGDGETWTVIATTTKSVTIQRSRDGALAPLGQLGEGRP